MKNRKVFVIIILTFSILLTSFSFYIYQVIKTPNVLVERKDKYLYIPSGASFKSVQDSLYNGDYVQDLVSFSVVAKLFKYEKNIKPGVYLLKSNMTNLQAVKFLKSGNQSPINLTFNNIRLKEDLADKLSRNLELSKEEIEVKLKNPAVAKKYGFNEHNFLAMFIPNTYEIYWNISADQLMDRMFKEYNKFWNEERLQKARDLKMSPPEVTTLSSIVLAESVKTDESPVIAGVYINRLRKNMPLQADPTLVYAARDFTIKRVLNVHKEIDSPYNTYKYTGLPPGPINLPGITYIDAVLNYKDHNYLYFCAKDDFSGYHAFATNLSDHMKNARRYQQALNKAKLYK
ncbi:MAG: endolytic transglycosylase MltG [Bacteroidota bacterium]|nr:endolytic transglycosylase MltG [Bacteroidota bacterium]